MISQEDWDKLLPELQRMGEALRFVSCSDTRAAIEWAHEKHLKGELVGVEPDPEDLEKHECFCKFLSVLKDKLNGGER